jgi:ligand-binding SRPBCC domain-containing protein
MQGMATFERSTVIRAPISEVFAFHLDTRNAVRISPRTMPVDAVRGEFPAQVGAAVELDVRLWPAPLHQTWRILIAERRDPVLVVDEMLRGPFAAWRHEHRFADRGDGTTELTDHVEYRLPFGRLGALAAPLVARPVLERMFRFRHARTRELLERG